MLLVFLVHVVWSGSRQSRWNLSSRYTWQTYCLVSLMKIKQKYSRCRVETNLWFNNTEKCLNRQKHWFLTFRWGLLVSCECVSVWQNMCLSACRSLFCTWLDSKMSIRLQRWFLSLATPDIKESNQNCSMWNKEVTRPLMCILHISMTTNQT